MNKILLIGGPTGVGKTSFATLCSDILNGYIISCDSMQIYKEMDIGTAKISPKEQEKYPHALIDIIYPNEEFSVENYVKLAKEEIKKAQNQNKVPIFVGGTGLYMRSLLFPYSFSSTQKNEELRNYYKNLCDKFGNEYVYNILKEKDPERAAKLHYNDIKRVIRALEILANGQIQKNEEKSLFDYELIVLTDDRETLYQRINKRVDEMFDMGLVDEVKNVIKKYSLTRQSQSTQAIGYREFFDYFEGKCTLEYVKDKIKQHSRNYAKRQITWFKTMPNAKFFTLQKKEDLIRYIKNSFNINS